MLAELVVHMPIVTYVADLIVAVAFGLLLGRIAAALRATEPATREGA